MPKYNKGDRVRVSLASHSPYRGQIGVVDDNPLSYPSSSAGSSGYWYVVRFEWKGLHPAARFMEEDLEPVTEGSLPEETPGAVQPVQQPPMNFAEMIIHRPAMRKYLIIGLIVVVVLAGSLITYSTIRRNSGTRTPPGFSTLPTQQPSPTVEPTSEEMKLSFDSKLTEAKAGVVFPVQPVVKIIDANGKIVTDSSVSVTLVVTNREAALYGTTTVNAVNGVATFTDLYIRNAGNNYTLTAISSGLTSAISSPLDVAPGPAAALYFFTKPSTSGLATDFSIMVTVLDSYGNIATDSTADVTLSITPGTGTSGAVLSGATTQKARNGVANFSYLSINPAQGIYKLTATSPGLTSTTSDSFNLANITGTQSP